eukprot:1184338-Prorocentrum_minimum.AAC.2
MASARAPQRRPRRGGGASRGTLPRGRRKPGKWPGTFPGKGAVGKGAVSPPPGSPAKSTETSDAC